MRRYLRSKRFDWRTYSILLFVLPLSAGKLTATSSDSLLAVWRNTDLPDSSRLGSYLEYLQRETLQSNPDSTLILAAQTGKTAQLNGYVRQYAEALRLMGTAFMLKSQFAEAERQYYKAISIFEQNGDRLGIARCKYGMGNVYHLQGKVQQALQQYLAALAIFRKIRDLKGEADGLLGIGNIYLEQKNYKLALSYYEQATETYRILNRTGELASALNNLGMVHYYLGNESLSAQFFESCLQMKKQLGKASDVAKTLQNLGGMSFMQGQHDKALEFYRRSLAISESIPDLWMMSTTYVDLGWLSLEKGQIDSAKYWCTTALSTAENIGSIEKKLRSCECLYEIHLEQGDEKAALGYYVRFRDLKDSMNSQEVLRTLQQVEFDKRMYRDSVQRAEEIRISAIKYRRTRNILFTSGLFATILAFGFWGRMRHHRRTQKAIEKEQKKSEELLLNILPAEIATELKEKGRATPRVFPDVAILFTDFKNFTLISEHIRAEDLIGELNYCFDMFDSVCDKYGIEKIKTIGDSYMAACGLPQYDPEASLKTVLAGLEMIERLEEHRQTRLEEGNYAFEMRCGIHTGNVVAGIVGHRKFQYDLWGDSVNTASRMESNGAEGKVNISKATYLKLADEPDLQFEFRGMVSAKGKGEIEMYFVSRKNGSISGRITEDS